MTKLLPIKLILFSVLSLQLFSVNAQFITAHLDAHGLTCALCSRSVEKRLEKLDFLERIDVDLQNTSFKLYFRSEVPIVIKDIYKMVESAGFSVGQLILNYQFDDENLQLIHQDGFFTVDDQCIYVNGLLNRATSLIKLEVREIPNIKKGDKNCSSKVMTSVYEENENVIR